MSQIETQDPAPSPMRPWDDLNPETQTSLLIEHGRWLDSLPPTCSMETKVARLRRWLAERGIDYRG